MHVYELVRCCYVYEQAESHKGSHPPQGEVAPAAFARRTIEIAIPTDGLRVAAV